MSFTITDPTARTKIENDLSDARDDPTKWAAFYTSVYNAITNTTLFVGDVTTFYTDDPKAGVDPAVWLWIKGAIGVNSNTGALAGYVRSYTAAQFELWTGNSLDTGISGPLQEASNRIATNFSDTLINTERARWKRRLERLDNHGRLRGCLASRAGHQILRRRHWCDFRVSDGAQATLIGPWQGFVRDPHTSAPCG